MPQIRELRPLKNILIQLATYQIVLPESKKKQTLLSHFKIKNMNKIIKNWKTTALGVLTIAIGAILYIKGDQTAALAALSSGIGLINAHDAIESK